MKSEKLILLKRLAVDNILKKAKEWQTFGADKS